MLRVSYKKKEWLREATALVVNGITTTKHLGDVASDVDLKGIESCFKDIVEYDNFKRATKMGITFAAKDVEHYDYLRFRAIEDKISGMKNGK